MRFFSVTVLIFFKFNRILNKVQRDVMVLREHLFKPNLFEVELNY